MNQKPSFLGHRERLRKKFIKNGLDSFLPHEVLEILLTYSIPRKDTKPIAWALLKKFGSLSDVLDAEENELLKIEGIGPSSVVLLKLMRGIMRSYSLEKIKERKEISSPESLVDYCRASLHGNQDEAFEVMFLTVRNTVIAVERICQGTLDRSRISPRKILERAFAYNAAGLIFIHNHPSGEPKPSEEDIHLTETLSRISTPVGIIVLDHIIVGRGKFFSMKSNAFVTGHEEENK